MATSVLSYDNRSSPSVFALGIGMVINDNPSKPWINYYIYIYMYIIYTRTPTRLHYHARLRARVKTNTANPLLSLPARVSEQGNWRASEASETLFSHVYENSRYIYVQVKKKAFKINAKIEDVVLNEY